MNANAKNNHVQKLQPDIEEPQYLVRPAIGARYTLDDIQNFEVEHGLGVLVQYREPELRT